MSPHGWRAESMRQVEAFAHMRASRMLVLGRSAVSPGIFANCLLRTVEGTKD